MTRKELTNAKWLVKDHELSPGQSRPDYDVERADCRYRVVPVFATDPGSRLLNEARERLQREREHNSKLGFRAVVIVLPRNSKSGADPQGDPAVIKLEQLLSFLEQGRSAEAPTDTG
jgi:hypothetical protein